MKNILLVAASVFFVSVLLVLATTNLQKPQNVPAGKIQSDPSVNTATPIGAKPAANGMKYLYKGNAYDLYTDIGETAGLGMKIANLWMEKRNNGGGNSIVFRSNNLEKNTPDGSTNQEEKINNVWVAPGEKQFVIETQWSGMGESSYYLISAEDYGAKKLDLKTEEYSESDSFVGWSDQNHFVYENTKYTKVNGQWDPNSFVSKIIIENSITLKQTIVPLN